MRLYKSVRADSIFVMNVVSKYSYQLSGSDTRHFSSTRNYYEITIGYIE
jgi:hypothetical protein